MMVHVSLGTNRYAVNPYCVLINADQSLRPSNDCQAHGDCKASTPEKYSAHAFHLHGAPDPTQPLVLGSESYTPDLPSISFARDAKDDDRSLSIQMTHELLGRHFRLAKNASKRSDGEITVKRDHTSYISLLAESPQDDMATGLSPPHKADPFQSTNRLIPRHASQFRHTQPQTCCRADDW